MTALVAAGCGGSSPGPAASSALGASAQTGLVSNCVAYYADGDFAAGGGSPSPSAATRYCGCVIGSLLKTGVRPNTIASAMDAAVTSGDYALPSIFGFSGGSCGSPPAASLGDQ
jgi:hypothetical protein